MNEVELAVWEHMQKLRVALATSDNWLTSNRLRQERRGPTPALVSRQADLLFFQSNILAMLDMMSSRLDNWPLTDPTFPVVDQPEA